VPSPSPAWCLVCVETSTRASGGAMSTPSSLDAVPPMIPLLLWNESKYLSGMILTDKSKGWAGWELRSGDVAVSSSPLCSARVRDVGLVVQLSLVLLLV